MLVCQEVGHTADKAATMIAEARSNDKGSEAATAELGIEVTVVMAWLAK